MLFRDLACLFGEKKVDLRSISLGAEADHEACSSVKGKDL